MPVAYVWNLVLGIGKLGDFSFMDVFTFNTQDYNNIYLYVFNMYKYITKLYIFTSSVQIPDILQNFSLTHFTLHHAVHTYFVKTFMPKHILCILKFNVF